MKNLPRLRFAHLPTPVESLQGVGTALNIANLWVKRDDQTGLAFGGNKTRKLELLVAEARANSARTLITTGAVQSNHCRQTAAAAARFGFDCILVLAGEKPAQASGNLVLDQLFGAEVIWTDSSYREQKLKETFDAAWGAGRRPYLVPYGGSSTTGAAAYTLAMQELLEQGQRPDWIVLASSSGGTQAGLVVGARIFGFQGRILGISVDQPAGELKARVAQLATETADSLGEKLRFTPDDILVNDGYLGGGYGVMGEPEREAIQLFARKDGLLLDPVYTGRAAAGLVDLARKGYFASGDSVLFWHTGGTPALFADRYRELI
ncbi:MAG: D-cysteine desulfhydrase family protein [Anaerolineales bacterium]|jgi:D-cysteine desulfhydrase family pyridoxal phosphate-dependent enzyme